MTDADDEIEALLPWYAAGALSEKDRRLVENALEARPELRASLATIDEDRGETIALNEALGAPSPEVWTKIMRGVEAAPQRPSLSARLAAMLGLGDARWAWVAVAAALVILLQAAAIVSLLPSAGYKTVTVDRQAAEGADVLVAFAPDAKLEALTAFLKANQATIVGGPRGGLYELRVGDKVLAKAELDTLVKTLSGSAVVTMALPGINR
jgi:anti-sigma-K factor RskA